MGDLTLRLYVLFLVVSFSRREFLGESTVYTPRMSTRKCSSGGLGSQRSSPSYQVQQISMVEKCNTEL